MDSCRDDGAIDCSDPIECRSIVCGDYLCNSLNGVFRITRINPLGRIAEIKVNAGD